MNRRTFLRGGLAVAGAAVVAPRVWQVGVQLVIPEVVCTNTATSAGRITGITIGGEHYPVADKPSEPSHNPAQDVLAECARLGGVDRMPGETDSELRKRVLAAMDSAQGEDYAPGGWAQARSALLEPTFPDLTIRGLALGEPEVVINGRPARILDAERGIVGIVEVARAEIRRFNERNPIA